LHGFPDAFVKRFFAFSLLLFGLLFGLSLVAQPFDGLSDAIRRGDLGNVKALMISRHGEIIYEDYFRGTQPDDIHMLHSVTKSVGSALVGIAHRQGKLQLDHDLERFFGALYPMSQGVYQNKRHITVENVLQQRHGIQWDEWSVDYRSQSNPVGQMMSSGDWYRYVLTQPMDSQPGEKFTYSTGVSTLMSRMIRFSTGLSPHAFAMQELFGPLGIEDVHWEGYSTQGQGHGMTDWPNPDHDQSLGFTLWLKPRAMLKIGELYLNGGVYNGRRIIDQAWIDASRATYSNSENTALFSDTPGSGYGYQWWITRVTDSRDRTWASIYASGWARQYIVVFPELDMVVVSVADDYNYNGPGIWTALRTTVLPEMQPRLDRRFNGAWYDPDTDGQGMTLEVVDEGQRLVGFWYTYGDNNSKRWFTFDGPIDESVADVSIIQTSGGAFLQDDPISKSEWGRGYFSVVDCNHITFEIDSEEVITSVPLSRLTGTCSEQ